MNMGGGGGGSIGVHDRKRKLTRGEAIGRGSVKKAEARECAGGGWDRRCMQQEYLCQYQYFCFSVLFTILAQ